MIAPFGIQRDPVARLPRQIARMRPGGNHHTARMQVQPRPFDHHPVRAAQQPVGPRRDQPRPTQHRIGNQPHHPARIIQKRRFREMRRAAQTLRQARFKLGQTVGTDQINRDPKRTTTRHLGPGGLQRSVGLIKVKTAPALQDTGTVHPQRKIIPTLGGIAKQHRKGLRIPSRRLGQGLQQKPHQPRHQAWQGPVSDRQRRGLGKHQRRQGPQHIGRANRAGGIARDGPGIAIACAHAGLAGVDQHHVSSGFDQFKCDG